MSLMPATIKLTHVSLVDFTDMCQERGKAHITGQMAQTREQG